MARAGEMRHRVRIEQRSSELDTAGQQVEVWTLFKRRRAAIERTPGSEVFASAQRQGRVPTVFKLRYLAGVFTGMRLIHECCGGAVLNITSAIDPDGRRADVLISTEELEGVSP